MSYILFVWKAAFGSNIVINYVTSTLATSRMHYTESNNTKKCAYIKHGKFNGTIDMPFLRGKVALYIINW